MTIRRDLETLAEQGVLERYRGGARTLLLRGRSRVALRAIEGLETKQRIAAAVADMIADGEAVVLDSGTTSLEVARLLRDRRVTVKPLSLQAANALPDAPASEPTARRRTTPARRRGPDRAADPASLSGRSLEPRSSAAAA